MTLANTPGYFGPKGQVNVLEVDATIYALGQQQAGAAIKQYDCVFLDGQYWKQVDAFAMAAAPASGVAIVGIAAQSGASGAAGQKIYLGGLISAGIWSGQFTSGIWAFAASGLGQIPVTTAPTQSGITQIILGKAITRTAIQLNPQKPVVIGT